MTPTASPTVSPVSPYDLYPDCDGTIYFISDGFCDRSNNNVDCAYDGGDCCECTCLSFTSYDCDAAYFDCVDPDADCGPGDSPSSASTAHPTVSLYPDCIGYPWDIGDGMCDYSNNNAGCGYDGGDCCSCTCVLNDDSYYNSNLCTNFDCVDPDTDCPQTPAPTLADYPGCTGNAATIQDGYCNDGNNNAECGYDGGDCCECTCISSSSYDCGGGSWYDDTYYFNCTDPNSGCIPTPSPVIPNYPDCTGLYAHIHDGFCDPSNNNADCGYDGGDCCECTCEPGDHYSCAEDDDFVEFDCRDADADCAPTPIIEGREAAGEGESEMSVGTAISVVAASAGGLFCVGGVLSALFVAMRRRRKARLEGGNSTTAAAPAAAAAAAVRQPQSANPSLPADDPGSNVFPSPAVHGDDAHNTAQGQKDEQ